MANVRVALVIPKSFQRRGEQIADKFKDGIPVIPQPAAP